MTELADRRCAACEGGVDPLDAAQAADLLSRLDGSWRLDASGNSIVRDFEFPNFARTMAFANAVAWIATVEGHHPVMTVRYGRCAIRYTTNAIGGLSDNDFICAAKVDRLVSTS